MSSLGFELVKILQGGRNVTKGMAESFVSGLQIQKGDKAFTILEKLANIRQRFEKAADVKLATVSPELKPIYENALAQIRKAVPFTVQDVLAAQKAKLGDRSLTFADHMAKSMPPAATGGEGGAGSQMPSDPLPGEVKKGYRFKGGNPSIGSNWERITP